MAETRRKVQLHKKGDQSDMWIPYTTGGCVQLTEYENDGVTSGAIVGGDDGDTLNTALMRLENRLPFVGATEESDGAQGEVPAPTLADKEKFLKGDGTWSAVESSEIGDGEVTIMVNGTPYKFTMNQSTNLQINISIPENPVIFKGTVNTTGINGTTTPFPAADATNNGHEYKVTEDGTYQGVSAKVDDILISNGVMWIKIPSGDEPSGTVTSIGATNGVKTDKTGGAAISDSGTLSLNLKTTTRSAYDSETPVDVSGRQYPVVLDKTNGYLSVNVPWENTHQTAEIYAGVHEGTANAATSNGNTHIIIKDGSSTHEIKIIGSDVGVTSNANGVITIDASNKADKQKDVEIAVNASGVFNRTTNASNAVLNTAALRELHLGAADNTLNIQSGWNYTFSGAVAALNIVASGATGDLETNVTFELASGATASDVVLPSGAKYVKEEPAWAAGGEYIISYYKGLFVFGEIGTKS